LKTIRSCAVLSAHKKMTNKKRGWIQEKIMKVQIIYPNLNAEEGFNHGVACLAGALKSAGHEVRLLNLNECLYQVPSIEEIVKQVEEYHPGIVAFSVQTMQYAYAKQISQAIRQARPEIHQVVGGVHATLCLQEMIAEKYWPVIGYGECDTLLTELVDRIEAGKDFSDLSNLAIRQNDGNYKINPLGPYPVLAELPPEDYEIFDLDHLLPKKNGWMSMLTSRGCPYRCSYCFNYELSSLYATQGHPRREYLRRYPVERVISEIIELTSKHPALEMIIFDDDLFTLDTAWVVKFAQAYNSANLKIPFVVNAHVQSFNEECARALSTTPCRIVKFGVEAGSDSLRRTFLKRFMTNDQIADAFALCKKYNLHSSAFLMIGMPGETIAQMNETIDLMVRIKPGRMRWSVFYPFPGTLSYKLAQEWKKIDFDRLKKLDNYFVTTALKFDPETELFVNKLQRVFHWYVNARIDGPAAEIYQAELKKIESMNLTTWAANRDRVLEIDRQISDNLLHHGVDHYSIRYTEVMAVHSQYLLKEDIKYRNQKTRAWKASAKE
jgi:anaerobic magnesium-protoporphyrin IX monomethyl ester cyclase